MKTGVSKLQARLTVAIITLSIAPYAARAEKGMFTFHAPPIEQVKAAHGFTMTPQWLDHVRLSSVRLNDGGSGAFVSPNGLVMTNHHVAVGQIQKVSTREKDYVRDGFYAKALQDEIRLPDLEINVLVGMENMTERVTGAVQPGASTEEANKQRKAEMAKIEKEAMDRTGLRSDVVELYQGGEYWLYQYKKYTDVRLVMAPEKDAAYFGGDYDNFGFPRHDLDFTFLRVYENDQPVHSQNYFKWSEAGAKEGELIFTSGHPGTTNRMKTLAQLQFDRDRTFPALFDGLKMLKKALEDYSATGSEPARQAKDSLFSINNSLKARQGMYEGLKNPEIWAEKEKEEMELRRAVANDPILSPKYGEAWDHIAQAKTEHANRFNEQMSWRFLRFGGLASIADTIVKYVTEIPKTNDDRYEEFRDSALDSMKLRLFSPAPIYNEMEKQIMAAGLELALKFLGPQHPLAQKMLAGQTPAAVAQKLISETKLQDPEFRKQLIEGGAAAVEASTDPLIQFFKSLDSDYRNWRKWFEDQIRGVESLMGNLIANARFAVFGKSIPPDATFTLRLSYGTVKGYEQLTTLVPAWTTFYGLFDRALSFAEREPFNLTKRLRRAWTRIWLRMSTPLNFVSTNDITGGNSGSPVINQRGEIVGLIFDGNIQGLPNDYVYSETQARAVSVHSAGIMEALRHIYRARRLVREILRARSSDTPRTNKS